MAGDGQMDAGDLPQVILPIQEGLADHVKGIGGYTPMDRGDAMGPTYRNVVVIALDFACIWSTCS